MQQRKKKRSKPVRIPMASGLEAIGLLDKSVDELLQERRELSKSIRDIEQQLSRRGVKDENWRVSAQRAMAGYKLDLQGVTTMLDAKQRRELSNVFMSVAEKRLDAEVFKDLLDAAKRVCSRPMEVRHGQ
jgi:hypothetical protein